MLQYPANCYIIDIYYTSAANADSEKDTMHYDDEKI